MLGTFATFLVTVWGYPEAKGKYVVEDGPYGGDGGGAWTDGSGVNINGHVTAIELRSGSEIDAIRARYGF